MLPRLLNSAQGICSTVHVDDKCLQLIAALQVNLFPLQGEGCEGTSDMRTSSRCRPSQTLYRSLFQHETVSLLLISQLAGCLQLHEQVCGGSDFPTIFNEKIKEVFHRYDNYLRVNCADCYSLYQTLCAMTNVQEYPCIHFPISTGLKAFNITRLVVSRRDGILIPCTLRRTFQLALHCHIHSAR